MPPKRKRSSNLDDPGKEGLYPDVSVPEDERTAPKKRGRKSIIDAILQAEARGTPAPVLPQNQWAASIVHSQDLTHTTNATKRRKVQPAGTSLATQKYPSPGTPSIWGANKGDFYSAFKSLAESFGGMCFANLGTLPVLAWLVEGPRPPEDILNEDNLNLSLVTDFRAKAQSDASTSAAGLKKKGRQNRRTKRGDLTTVPTDLDNAGNTSFHVGTGGLTSEPQKQWPCLVESPIFNSDYPTFCDCLRPQCSRHCPVARDLLFRRCTEYSWPDPVIIGFNKRSMPPEPRANCETGGQTGDPGDLNKDPSASSEYNPRVQGEDHSTSIPVSSFLLPLSTTKIYAQVVPELASLLDHMERKDPILVISTTDARMDSVLPFQLPPKYGCVVLGFFNVENVECESGNRPTVSSIQPGTLSWKVHLRYASASDPGDGNGNLAPPWWLHPPTTLSPPLPAPELEMGGIKGEGEGEGKAPMTEDTRWCVVQALDGNLGRTWWHCLDCGRINQRDMLLHRRCPSCQRNEDPAPASVIEDVLQDASTAPYPFNHTPRSMKPGDILVKEFGDMTSVYCYNFHDEPLTVNLGSKKGAGVKHIFTGPYEGLKIEATGLFSQIQEGIELRWQGVRTGIAEGPYYSWESPRHGWVDSEIPRCIHQAQKLISKLVSNYGEKEPGDEHGVYETLREEKPGPSTSSEGMIKKDDQAAENVRINHVVALAWTASGSKRGTFVSAKDSAVFILCLGATVELDLERCAPEVVTVTNTGDSPAVHCDVVISEGIDGEGGQKGKGKRPRKSQKEPVPQSNLETDVNPKGKKKDKGKEKSTLPQPKPKASAPAHERLRISMVHGDVLILSGGDFIYTLTRTGMSILLFALSDAQ